MYRVDAWHLINVGIFAILINVGMFASLINVGCSQA
jgi:hypothetical protein